MKMQAMGSVLAMSVRATSLTLAMTVSLWSLVAQGAVPETIGVEGRLTSLAGGAVADGSYTLTFSLYGGKGDLKPSWTEVAKLDVASGRFSHALGATTKLNPTALSAATSSWLGVKVGQDPELPRVPLRSVAFALRAALAQSALTAKQADNAALAKLASDLSCSGCVSVKELKFDGDVDLAGNSLKAKNATFTGTVAAANVTAASFVGDGSKLTGVQFQGGSCKAGQVVVGVQPDGSVQCAKAASGGDLLGGKVSDTFTEVSGTSKLPVNIPDNTGASATVQTVFGKVGTANSLSVSVELSNTDLSTVSVVLMPPDDKKVGLKVCDPCGAKDAKSYKVTLTETSQLKSGSLKDYIGKSLEGSWTLQVLDSSFCLPQLAGNDKLCDSKNKLDGAVSAFSISATVTSAQSVKMGGTLQLALLPAPPFACQPSREGHVFYDIKIKRLRFCDGKVWRSLSDTCGNGILEAGEECDDGNNTDGDGCSAVCVAGYGFGKDKPGLSCKDILAKLPNAKSGRAWIKPSGYGGVPIEVWCDMSSYNGGWTQLMRGSGKTMEWSASYWTQSNVLNAGAVTPAWDSAKFESFNHMPITELLLKSKAGHWTVLKLPSGGKTALSWFKGGAQALTYVAGKKTPLELVNGNLESHCGIPWRLNSKGSYQAYIRLGGWVSKQWNCSYGADGSGQPTGAHLIGFGLLDNTWSPFTYNKKSFGIRDAHDASYLGQLESAGQIYGR